MEALKQSGGGGGGYGPFTPYIKWEDGEDKYVAILNPVDEIPKIFIHEYIPVGEREAADGTKKPIYAEFLDRTAPPIGDDVDPLTEKGSPSKERNIAVGVELEPIMGTGKGGRARPKGFEVKTNEFKRRIFDDDGEDTGEKEDVVAPAIGFITQSGYNFFGYLGSFNEDDGPHEDVAFRVKRRGGDKNTAYDWTPFIDQELDLSNVVDYIDGISYLKPELDEVLAEITDKDLDDQQAAHLIASKLLDMRLEELADPERYEELTSEIEEIKPKFGGKKKGKDDAKKTRKSQASRRTKAKAEADEPEPDPEPDPEPEEETPSKEDRVAAFQELRKKSGRNKK